MRFVPFWKSRAPGPSDRSVVRASDEITPPLGTDKADQLDRLVADVDRLGREQFRTTTLLEGCGASLDELGEALRQHIDQELHEHTESLRALSALEDQVRLRFAKDLLPVADALQASILAAREVGAGRQARARWAQGSPNPWQRMLRFLKRGRPGMSELDQIAALEGWLEGLVLVERRLMALLDREGVRPIAAVGERFDPQFHLAVAVSDECGVADGTIVAEEVRGYTFGDRILRHAEVVVARVNQPVNAQGRSRI